MPKGQSRSPSPGCAPSSGRTGGALKVTLGLANRVTGAVLGNALPPITITHLTLGGEVEAQAMLDTYLAASEGLTC